jgi:hypothetical protein
MVAGVGQRMLVAVAKRTAGEFFAAVDDVLTGKQVPAAVGAAPNGTPAVIARPAAAAAPQGGFARGVLVGAAVALAGVVVGAAVGRLTGRR